MRLTGIKVIFGRSKKGRTLRQTLFRNCRMPTNVRSSFPYSSNTPTTPKYPPPSNPLPAIQTLHNYFLTPVIHEPLETRRKCRGRIQNLFNTTTCFVKSKIFKFGSGGRKGLNGFSSSFFFSGFVGLCRSDGAHRIENCSISEAWRSEDLNSILTNVLCCAVGEEKVSVVWN